MKTHHFKALYFRELGAIEQQFIINWFDDHKAIKYTGKRFSCEMIILDEELIYNLIRKMNRLRNRISRDSRIDHVILNYEPQYCCNKTGTIV